MKIKNNHLTILEIEKNQAEQRLKQQINTVRVIVDNLDLRMQKGEELFDSDGLQGNGVYLDSYLNKVVAYQRSIEQFKRHLEKQQ